MTERTQDQVNGATPACAKCHGLASCWCPTPTPPEHAGLSKRWFVYFEGDSLHGTCDEARAKLWRDKDPLWIHEVALARVPAEGVTAFTDSAAERFLGALGGKMLDSRLPWHPDEYEMVLRGLAAVFGDGTEGLAPTQALGSMRPPEAPRATPPVAAPAPREVSEAFVRRVWDEAQEEAASRSTIEGKALSGRQLDDAIIAEVTSRLRAALSAETGTL